MNQKRLLSTEEKGLFRILSPAVGYYFNIPANNTFLSEGALAGQMRILNITYNLFIPQGVYGRVRRSGEAAKAMAVQYQQELFTLQSDAAVLDPVRHMDTKDKSGTEPGETGTVISAFTTGIFYRRPSPDAPPFVQEGEEIRKGKVMGLIEVMKAFNHLVFRGVDGDEEGTWRIKKVLVEDAAEVKLGEALFIIEKII